MEFSNFFSLAALTLFFRNQLMFHNLNQQPKTQNQEFLIVTPLSPFSLTLFFLFSFFDLLHIWIIIVMTTVMGENLTVIHAIKSIT